MSVMLPKVVDVWRMVTARRSFSGLLPIESLDRLKDMLESAEGNVSYTLDFGTDALGVAYLAVKAEAPLTLMCQRTLKPFVLPVGIDTRLGLLRHEQEEAALPPGYEPLLVGNGEVEPAAVIEDELLLAVPLVPVDPDSEWPEQGYDNGRDMVPDEPEQKQNPFAVLRELKKH